MRVWALLLALALTVACDAGEGRRERADGAGRRQPNAQTVPERRYERPRVVGHLGDPALVETSGIVASRLMPGAYWAHNDSDGAPVIYCVRTTGDPCGAVTISGAGMVDWEDIAAGSDGTLYIGDIGDNLRSRASITVYRVAEPDPPGKGARSTSEPARAIELRYPKGAPDAEALLVHPRTNDLYLVTKDPPGLVYRADAEGGVMNQVARLELPGLFSLPTGGDISSDGQRAIVGTYGAAFEFELPEGGSFDDVWKREPREVSLPVADQREAIAYGSDGDAIVTTSEGRGAAIVERRVSTD